MSEEQKASSRRSPWLWIGIAAGLFTVFLVVVMVLAYAIVRAAGGGAGFTLASGNIGVIDIDGVILNAETPVDQLRKFNQDDSIKAIILHIDSPGGGAAASQEIYREVRRIRNEKKKPIVASVESTGASGAYYIASGAGKIYANEASIVGSIGVILEYTNYGDLLRWAKLKDVIIKAGDLKDAGSPTRDLTPKEQAYFQGIVDNMHDQFIADVAAGRGMSASQIRPLATGQVWTGQQALPLHLIDQIGGFRDALLATAKQVGISGEPQVVKPVVKKKGLLEALLSSPDDLLPGPEKLLLHSPGFYFLWK